MSKLIITISLILVLSIIMYAQENPLDKKVDINADNLPLKDVIAQISLQAGIDFSYNPMLIPVDSLVIFHCNQKPLTFIIEELLGSAAVGAKVVESQLVLYHKNKNTTAKSNTISGTVLYSLTKTPIQYAAVYLKDHDYGTICDENGHFEFEIKYKNFDDTLILSAMGYKRIVCPAKLFMVNNELEVLMEDSVFMIDEITALSYDHIESLFWTSKETKDQNYLLTFATREVVNCKNFISFIKEVHGQPTQKDNVYTWKKARIDGVDKEKLKIKLKFINCNYCPIDNQYTITIEVTDMRNKNVLYNYDNRIVLTSYFQNILNKSYAQGVDLAQLQEKEGLMFIGKDYTPYSGGCYSFYEFGQVKKKGYYVDGLMDGHWTEWYSNGQAGKEVVYDEGRLDGEANFWYENGQKKFTLSYREGLKDGTLNYWYEEGQKRLEASYTNDRLDGVYQLWYENGRLAKKAIYKNGVPISGTKWSKTGKIEQQF